MWRPKMACRVNVKWRLAFVVPQVFLPDCEIYREHFERLLFGINRVCRKEKREVEKEKWQNEELVNKTRKEEFTFCVDKCHGNKVCFLFGRHHSVLISKSQPTARVHPHTDRFISVSLVFIIIWNSLQKYQTLNLNSFVNSCFHIQ